VKNVCDHCCLKVENLGVVLERTTILEQINLHINCGQLYAIIGPNGAGKTTLLRALLKEIPYQGTVTFRFKGEKQKNFRIGYVPQKIDFMSDSPISVEDLMASALGRQPVWLGIGRKCRKNIEASLSMVSAEHLMKKRIGDLSGGELQRVFLALAMSPRPEILLLDEPVSAVDAKGLLLFYRIVNDLRKSCDVSIIMVTHDIAGITPFADYMILLNRSILAQGSPQEVLSNKSLLETLAPAFLNVSKVVGLTTANPKNSKDNSNGTMV
jgi:zinc transport system ATP-binding protein